MIAYQQNKNSKQTAKAEICATAQDVQEKRSAYFGVRRNFRKKKNEDFQNQKQLEQSTFNLAFDIVWTKQLCTRQRTKDQCYY